MTPSQPASDIVCEFLGIRPRREIDCCCGRGGGCQCTEMTDVYPNLLSGDGLLLMEKALNEKGYGYMFVRMFKHLDPMVRIEPDGIVEQAPSLPEALFRAVLELARREKG